MKLALTRISLFTIKAQRYVPVMVMALATIAMVITMHPPDGGGDIGR